MPYLTMGTQTGNSCAAHCTVIAIAELFNTRRNMTPAYAEQVVWPAIMFQTGEGPVVDALVERQNSDPRRVLAFVRAAGGGEAFKAKLVCDETAKVDALNFVVADLRPALSGLFNMLKTNGSDVQTELKRGVYHNCSYLMFDSANPSPDDYSGMHNILVTKSGANVMYYNPNEAVPAWVAAGPGDAWKRLNGQNGGTTSYVFTGVSVVMKAAE